MARIPLPPMGPAAEAVRQRLDAARTGVDGLVPTLLPHPELAAALLDLDRHLDEGSVLPAAHREVVALQAAAGLRCGLLWAVHRRRAETAGIPASLVLAIETAEAWTGPDEEAPGPGGRPEPDDQGGPGSLSAATAATLRATVAVVLADGTLDDDLQARALGVVGLAGLLEVVVRTGRHRTLAGLVFAIDEPLPPGADDPWGRLRP
ncbi:MAG: hypothetical protein U0Q07_10680 [Acidimicrobiales bacterium]